MIPEFGLFFLILSLCFSILLSITPILPRLGHGIQSESFVSSFALGQSAFALFSFLVLAWAFYTNDFSVAYVAHNSNVNLPTGYKLSAIWGGHEGSMLLWYCILCGWTGLFCIHRATMDSPESNRLKLYSSMILGLLAVGFNLFIIMTSNPFARYLPEIPLEGADLNPLLQDFGLIIHPPILYLGYVGFAVPFALSLGYLLITNNVENSSIKNNMSGSELAKIMRSWTLSAWSFLTVGIALGSWWAYYELGWGGWWFWDPVENASFMPWLVGIALLHMIKVTQKRDAFIKWTILLAISCFSLSVLGTFLVRSGILSSVHAFATDPLRGQFIFKLLAILVGGALLLFGLRAHRLSAQKVALFSREGIIYLGSVLLFVSMASILLGTLYPMIIDAVLHRKLSVGAPYFNLIFIPFVSLIVWLMSIAPHITWMQAQAYLLVYYTIFGVLLSAIISIILLLLFGITLSFKLILGLSLSIGLVLSFVILAIKRFQNNTLWNHSFIAMSTAHLGVAISIAGVTLTSHLDIEKDVRMKMGDRVSVGHYEFYLKDLIEIEGPNYEGIKAEFEVFSVIIDNKKNKDNKDKKFLMHLYPEKRLYMPRAMPISETAISPGLFKDLYVALGEPLDSHSWSVRVYVKPFVRWIWIGALLMAIGGMWAAFGRSKVKK